MAQSPKSTTQKPAEQPAPASGYTEVALVRSVVIEGHLYKAGLKHLVDAAVLAAMGDAVATQRLLS